MKSTGNECESESERESEHECESNCKRCGNLVRYPHGADSRLCVSARERCGQRWPSQRGASFDNAEGLFSELCCSNFGGIAIVLGLVIYGAKVMRTVGERLRNCRTPPVSVLNLRGGRGIGRNRYGLADIYDSGSHWRHYR